MGMPMLMISVDTKGHHPRSLDVTLNLDYGMRSPSNIPGSDGRRLLSLGDGGAVVLNQCEEPSSFGFEGTVGD